MLFPGAPVDYEKDIALIEARRWATGVPLDAFMKITGADKFPQSIPKKMRDDILN